MDLSTRPRSAIGLMAATALLSSGAGCTAGANADRDDRPEVVAAFGPLAHLATRLAGNRMTVSNLTRPGVEPHDLELSPAVARIADADLVVSLPGFQPAVDQAITQADSGAAQFDAAAPADLVRVPGSRTYDPHFWLDPERYSAVATALARALGQVDPTHRDEFASHARALESQFAALDDEFATGLADCDSHLLVTSHEAFGYLAARYGFEQIGITGLDPAAEPDPAALADVADIVRGRDVATIYFEALVSPAVAEAVAAETGATTAMLDPLEGLGDEPDDDYAGMMRENLAALRSGQGCR